MIREYQSVHCLIAGSIADNDWRTRRRLRVRVTPARGSHVPNHANAQINAQINVEGQMRFHGPCRCPTVTEITLGVYAATGNQISEATRPLSGSTGLIVDNAPT